ncbi:hypothetical protein BHE74_00003864 [Ensete ventricosum]|nr:hypothetical protein BHE74_00003864 [Ensete ventricosum]RZR75941.1 hypothetical protein BHM03_00000526 [Ensete ventricosum]
MCTARTSLPTDRYADHPLLGDTVDWGCFRPGGTKKKREKKNLESRYSSPALSVTRERFLHRRVISSPRTERRNVSLRGEKERDDVTDPFFIV